MPQYKYLYSASKYYFIKPVPNFSITNISSIFVLLYVAVFISFLLNLILSQLHFPFQSYAVIWYLRPIPVTNRFSFCRNLHRKGRPPGNRSPAWTHGTTPESPTESTRTDRLRHSRVLARNLFRLQWLRGRIVHTPSPRRSKS